MKYNLFPILFLSLSLMSCIQESPKVKHKSNMTSSKSNIKNVVVVNIEDPICHMKTTEYTTDTAVYKNNIYGFCSSYCKDEFKKNPGKYAQK
ncbi:YHS domain-containing protein [Chryseobacterium potabilaquae]|uniref:YHS domain-containing protein n=1 Tax=Chryseobacterium potabilaquae TaxID=2675057 RepID=A0A6N4X7Y0_9FLAO|nr:YHS domain-containing protein [Chryseobacterium potabilaquae]CAA7194328.1 hypothetical protein CHRY9293_00661 [Chryseobacterium potabilaquae]